MTPKQFVDYAKDKVEQAGVKLILADREYLYIDNVNVNGYFSEEDMQLVCATGRPLKLWFPIFVHEFCHFEQMQDDCRAWKQSRINGVDPSDQFFNWIVNGKYPFLRMKEIAKRLRICETDCERRSVKNIKKFKLPLDSKEYCQRANAYIYFYNYALLKRRWWRRGHAPYDQKGLYSRFPTDLNQRYDKLSKKYVELYDEFC